LVTNPTATPETIALLLMPFMIEIMVRGDMVRGDILTGYRKGNYPDGMGNCGRRQAERLVMVANDHGADVDPPRWADATTTGKGWLCAKEQAVNNEGMVYEGSTHSLEQENCEVWENDERNVHVQQKGGPGKLFLVPAVLESEGEEDPGY
jgi:hypothetical protein